MLLINLIVLALIIWFAYKLIRMVFEAVKIAVKQANYLEQQFGPDVVGAAKFVIAGSKRQHDDG